MIVVSWHEARSVFVFTRRGGVARCFVLWRLEAGIQERWSVFEKLVELRQTHASDGG